MRQQRLASLQDAVAAEERTIRELQQRYPVGCPTPEEIRAQRENLVLLRNVFAQENLEEAVSASSAQSPRLMRLFGAAGVLFLLAAPFCLFAGRLVAGISLAIVGLLALLTTLWLYISVMQKQLLTDRGGTAAKETRAAAAARKREAEDALEQFLERYRLPGDTPENLLNQAEEDLYRGAEAQRRLVTARQQLASFLRENPQRQDALQEQASALPKLEELQASERKLQEDRDKMEKQRNLLQQEYDGLRGIADSLPDLEDKMARVQTALREDKRKCALTDRTITLLQQAKDRLSNGYVGKIEAGFRKYAEMLLDGQLGDVILDKDLRLHIDEKGASRELGCFSAGMTDSILLCMRLALTDALFDGEKPFLILDDPFVNLDDLHMQRVLGLLRRLSAEHQILYLVCNSSRADGPLRDNEEFG